ncbi:MAG: LL-diaminopimelate aminotransferase [Deltaproteobacteria bacterium]|uniref:Aminotransferase n=1 Tax=Candidatus Zymogenus saltonus TaxID=2844893 RepID=A0A9D8PPZ1_9DELT|nr:LL-diaminopimelate aminotransferase [Candidatus Zymogenus saltonus]
MKIDYARRIKSLPPYLFDKIDTIKNEMTTKGVDIIDLGVGDPDIPTPKPIVDVIRREVERGENHRYPFYKGMEEFRKACADWYKERFGVSLSYKDEVLSVIGSKEAISHIPVAFVNPGDVVLVPEPGYPVYAITSAFMGGKAHYMPLLAKNDFMPDLGAIPKEVAKRAVLMYLNYPNNPTSAPAADGFFEEVVAFAKKNNVIVCHDAAYTELYFDNKRPKSFLETPGATDVGMEIHSLSKTFNMTGWRIGFAVGNSKAVGGLGKAKSNMDSGIFQPIQYAAAYALRNADELSAPIRDIYQKRRDVLSEALSAAGLDFIEPVATFYFWVSTPDGESSESFAELLLKKANIVVTPGNGFGMSGEGYIRLTLCTTEDRLKEAGERIVSAMK